MPAPTYPLYVAGSSGTSHADEVAQGGYVIEFPFGERRPEALIITQRFQQLRTSYVRPSPNVLNCPAYPTARFCSDGGFRDHGMGLIEWVRTWATVPDQVVDFETFAYTFPGYAASLAAYGRVPITQQVTSRLTLDFFLVGPGGTYATPADIPAYAAQAYTYGPYTGDLPAEYLSATSLPTLTTYKGYATTDAASASSYSLEAADSILENYLGNIWRRTRRHVKAR